MPWKPGESGNSQGSKAGAKKKQKQIKELLSHLVPRAVRVIEEMLGDDDHKQFASKEILDRVYGKAPQAVEVSGQIETIIVNVVKKQK